MKSTQPKQYSIRNLTVPLDQRLRQKARESGKSLNEVVLETLHRGAGLAEETPIYHDLDDLIGKWREDPAFEEALQSQDQIDPKLWS